MTTKRLWLGLALVMGISFAILIFFGTDIYRQAPPIPKAVLSASGDTLFTGQEIKDGQNVWQSIGGQTVGSIWGHGAYIAPDWTADYLHREALLVLAASAAKEGKVYERLSAEEQALYKERMKQALRKNTYDASSNTLVYTNERAAPSGNYPSTIVICSCMIRPSKPCANITLYRKALSRIRRACIK